MFDEQEDVEVTEEELEESTEETEEVESDESEEIEVAEEGDLELEQEVAEQIAPFDPMDLPPKVREMHEALSLRAQIEAALFASPKPVRPADLVELVSYTSGLKEVEAIVQDLKEEYATREGGFTLEYIKGMGYQFQSVAQAAPIMEGLFSSRPRPLSRAALETLSIIAYRQPCTRAVVEFIRGVDSGSIIKNLMERELIKCVGRKEDAGRPMLFGTTDEFLAVFGVRSLDELPPLQSFQPASETVQQSLNELDELERGEVDIEEFVGDETEPQPEISGGLLEEEVVAETSEAAEEAEVAEASAETEAVEQIDEPKEQPIITGAVAADPLGDDELEEQENKDAESEDPETDVLVASGLDIDPGGADLS